MGQRTFLGQVKLVFAAAAPPRFAGLAIVVLGLASALLEGFGLLLFIPLLQSLGAAPASAGGPAWREMERLLTIPGLSVTAGLVALLCASIILKNGVNLLNGYITRYMDGTVAHRLRVKIFAQTLASSVDHQLSRRRSDIANTLSVNSWQVGAALRLIFRMIVALVTLIVFVALMVRISLPLTLVAMGSLALASIVIRLSTRRADAVGQAVVWENKQFGQRSWESIESLQLIRAFGREDYERRRFEANSENVRRRHIAMEMLWALPGPISEVAITLVIGGLVLAAGQVGVGIPELAAFLTLLYRIQGPTRDIAQSRVALEGMIPAICDVVELDEATATPLIPDGTRDVPPVSHAIAFQNVWYRYGPDEAWALRDVTFTIPAGKTTAIVGQSGAGKSTLLSLLFRFVDPVRGQIACDETPLAQMRLDQWRARLALMPQDVQLFHDTVHQNIGYGREGATFEEIKAAAEVARAHDFILNLPEGYHTMIGDQGVRLSGGQRQRLALARTVLRNPDVLILDEATNSLDVESEQAFQSALDRYARGRTVVVVAHRLSTGRRADHIIVLGEGRILEAGSPDQLLKDKGRFAHMFAMQQNYAASPVVDS